MHIKTIMPNFIPIRFKMTEPRTFSRKSPQQEQEQDELKVKQYSSPEQVISQLRGVTWHMRWHSVICHPTQVNTVHPALAPARQATTRFAYPRGMEGWVDPSGSVHTKIVYLSARGHPSK